MDEEGEEEVGNWRKKESTRRKEALEEYKLEGWRK